MNSMEDVLAAYAEPVLLSENGYTVFMLKTVGADDACIFLKDNRCTIHSVHPRAVSYTHLDVYKRQVVHSIGVSSFRKKEMHCL